MAAAETRLALIVGNGSYSSVTQLDNPVPDAELMAQVLTDKGFTVTMLTDADLGMLNRGIAQFGRDLRAAGEEATGRFYYAGHAVQSFGENYLLPVDTALTDAADLSLVAVDAQAVLRQMRSARNRTNIVILDACRNNPYYETSPDDQVEIVEIARTTRSIGYASLDDLSNSKGGLAQLANLRGLSAVAFFSTEPGNVAEDGDQPGKGSPFAIEFAKQIERRQSLDEVFRKTAIAVNMRTDIRQSPWRQGDLAFNVFVSGMRALPIP